MRAVARALAFVTVSAAALVSASVLMYFPVVVWHRYRPPEVTSVMRYRAAEARVSGEPWRLRYAWMPLDRISPHMERAVLAAEDSRFYEHHGFDLEQIRAAWERRERGGELRGASTITQQTVKNLYLTPQRSFLRKIREAALTAWMELWLPKRRILELYLNIVELGPGVFGVEAAARAYFDRPAARLTQSEAALLAATLPAPLLRNPARPTPGLRRLQALVLRRMERWYGSGERIGPPSPAAAPARRPSVPLELPAEATEAPLLPADTLVEGEVP